MTVEDRFDAGGNAWTFALSAEDIADAGGSVLETYTANFSFLASSWDESWALTFNAFGLGQGTVIPLPHPAALAGIGLAGVVVTRRQRTA